MPTSLPQTRFEQGFNDLLNGDPQQSSQLDYKAGWDAAAEAKPRIKTPVDRVAQRTLAFTEWLRRRLASADLPDGAALVSAGDWRQQGIRALFRK